MRIYKNILLIITICFVLFGCAAKQAFYEPCEGDDIGEEDDGAISIERVAVFMINVNGKDAILYNNSETFGELFPGKEIVFARKDGMKIVAIFKGYATMISLDYGLTTIFVPEEE